MSLDPADRESVLLVQALIRRYRDTPDPPHEPFATAAVRELGGDWEARGHEVAIGYLHNVLGISREDVGWLMAHPMALPVARRAYESFQNPDPRIRLFEDEDKALLRSALETHRAERTDFETKERKRVDELLEALE